MRLAAGLLNCYMIWPLDAHNLRQRYFGNPPNQSTGAQPAKQPGKRGKGLMVLYRKATTSTIRTETLPIIVSIT